jgi:asparagine synthetase B (glutamine-hydrolysing)
MCGIFFSLSSSCAIEPDEEVSQLLRQRGPDANGLKTVPIPATSRDPNGGVKTDQLYAYFYSSVLALRGDQITRQPFTKTGSDSILCWNGEVWKAHGTQVEGNDTAFVFDLLCKASERAEDDQFHSSVTQVLEALHLLRGPYAFVFFDALRRRVYFGRDCLGRRSLLRRTNEDGHLTLSSVSSKVDGESWVEVEADGLYMIQLRDGSQPSLPFQPLEVHSHYDLFHIPYSYGTDNALSSISLVLPYPRLNRSLPEPDLILQSGMLDGPALQLQQMLRQSLHLRLRNLHEGQLNNCISSKEQSASRLAILFSGGLDCTVLARLAHEVIPLDEPIDLLNVAFENPRVHKSANCELGNSPYGLCPDRITGLSSFEELKKNWPDREWRLVEINIPYSETLTHRARIVDLMYPHNTEMDLSISCALYFASRGIGLMTSSQTLQSVHYESSARILLSGLGADELFGGYQRHATAFSRHAHPGLIDELELDVTRLGKRNLGRDDRVISHWGKEVRFPYLDEDFMAWALSLPAWQKCGFGEDPSQTDDGSNVLDPAKKILRLAARGLGLKQAANEKKRAVSSSVRLLFRWLRRHYRFNLGRAPQRWKRAKRKEHML